MARRAYHEPLLPQTTAVKKTTWFSTWKSSLAATVLLLDLVSHIAVYLWAFSFNIQALWDADVTNYSFKSSMADVFFMGLMRAWISSIALHYRWSYLGVALGCVSLGFMVVKAAESSLWTYPQNVQKDFMMVASLLFSIMGPAVTVPFAVVSLQRHTAAIEAEREPSESPKTQLSMKELFKVLMPYFWPRGIQNRVLSISTWFILAVSKVSNIIGPLYLAKATNHLQSGELREATLAVGIYCTLKFVSSTFKEFQNMAYLRVKQAAYIEIAQTTFVHLHSLSLDWHLRKKMGNVLRAMDRGVESANSVVNYLFLYLLPTIAECLTVCGIFILHYRNPSLAILVFFCLVLYVHITIQLTLWRKKFREATNKHDNAFHERATDSLINFETVKYFCNEEHETQKYCESVSEYQKYSIGTQMSLSLLNISQQFLQLGCMCAAMIIMVYSGSDIGAFVAVQAYLLQLFTPLNFLGSIYGALVNGLVDIMNLSELLAESPDLLDRPNAPPLLCAVSEPPGFEFRNVSFHYPTQGGAQGLHDVSFTADGSKVTAVVGSTGSGKTTLGRLLFRFYDPLSGTVLIGGRDVADFTQKSVRRAIGVVPQDTCLFNDTILHNVRYGRMEATMEDIEASCEKAQILTFILSLPDQWQTKVGERGLKLSGGEKQRVAIARCLLKDPPLVLLDEATSALDSRTERDVQSALHDLGQNRTTMVIAHRLSTVRTADRIVVMDHGRVLESDTHDRLLMAGGTYSLLWNAQVHEHDAKGSSEDLLIEPPDVFQI